MRHFDLLLLRHPHLRHVDYQRLVQKVKTDPEAHWDELVEACAPVVHTAALRLAGSAPHAKSRAQAATQQVFEGLAENDFALLQEYVGYGRFPSELVLMTAHTRAITEIRAERDAYAPDLSRPVADPDGEIPVLEASYAELMEREGDRFLEATAQVIQLLHRADRLLLALRYEQELHLAEIDQLLRLGTARRVGSLIDRVVTKLQPIQAVADAWEMTPAQRQALTRAVVQRVFADADLATAEGAAVAPATQGR